MIRPKRMSKVSIAGAKPYLAGVIEELHKLNLVHVTDYDGAWEGFSNGEPREGSEAASEKLVQIRSIENTLGLDEVDLEAGTQDLDGVDVEERLEEVRQEVNELDDERSEVRDQLREVREQKRQLEPFLDLDVDLELLRGYRSIEVAVGRTEDPENVREVLRESSDVGEFEVFGDEVVVVAAETTTDLNDVLVGGGLDFAQVEIPEAEGSPKQLIEELDAREVKLEQEFQELEERRKEIRDREASFLLALEERLSIEVQKGEIPLQFATTENSFVAEGWIPHDQYDELQQRLEQSVEGHVEVEELRQADYDEETEENEDSPPIVQGNPPGVDTFETLVNAVSLPRYSELDPTLVVFLTFPLFFGFMIGDIGYGAIYAAIGYYMTKKFDSPAVKSMGVIGIWAGAFTVLFGVLYGEIFGLHVAGEVIWGEPPLKKGLQASDFALLWLTVSVVAALLHVNVGYVFGFINELRHGFKDAVLEKGSWILLMNGVWIWVFSSHLAGSKPPFIFRVFDGEPIPLGFAGFPAEIGYLGLAATAVGLVLLIMAEGGVALPESLQVLVNVLSYARIPAVLLAKAGMAFVVNLLVFGVYEHHEELHFMLGESPSHVADQYGAEAVLFPGILNLGDGLLLVVGVVFGVLVLVLGHIVVLALGITSAGLQAIRLEYVEFFGKFYEGGGKKYQPFGYDRSYTTEE